MGRAPREEGAGELVRVNVHSGEWCRSPTVGEEREAMPEAAAAVHPNHLHAAR